jgi:hypothetical protein
MEVISINTFVVKVDIAPCVPIMSTRPIITFTNQDIFIDTGPSKHFRPINSHRHPTAQHNRLSLLFRLAIVIVVVVVAAPAATPLHDVLVDRLLD